MKSIIVTFLFLTFAVAPSLATEIDVKGEGTVQHGGARGPARLPIVTADISDGEISSTIDRFEGQVQIYICDDTGAIVDELVFNSNGKSNPIMQVTDLKEGEYSIYFVLNGFRFSGTFSILTNLDYNAVALSA